MKNIAIIGSGSWGVALGIHLANMGNIIKIWSFDKTEADLINEKRQCKFLPNIKLPENIECKLNYEEVIKNSDIILHVTPSKFTRNILKEYKQYVINQPIIICSKGLEAKTYNTLDKIFEEELPNTKIGVLSGPSHAEEVSLGIPTAIVIASKHSDVIEEVQETFMNEKLRVYSSKDVVGVELGGALKNIIAFCAGMAAGLNLGDNTFAALTTRGLKEIAKLGVELGGDFNTFYGLTGLGDLIVTVMSEHSRNRTAGKLIAQGKSIEEARSQVGMVIEGLDNIEIAYELAKIHNIEMPIVEAVYDVLYNGLSPEKAVIMLMTRDKKAE